MPCTEITNAINWSKQSTGTKAFPVTAYFTKHFGKVAAGKDSVHYASGEVVAVDTPKPHLKGTLAVAANTDIAGQMVSKPKVTYDVEMDPDGAMSYLMKINTKPVPGMPATKVQATCVNNVLLTATTGSEVVSVGVDLQPFKAIPQ